MSQELGKLYILARRAKETQDLESAREYYKAILMEEPDSWEANLYVTFFSFVGLKSSDLEWAADRMMKCIKIVMEQISKVVLIPEYESAIEQLYFCSDRISVIVCEESERLYKNRQLRYSDSTTIQRMNSDSDEFIDAQYAAARIMYYLGDCIAYYYKDNEYICKIQAASAWKSGVYRHSLIVKHLACREDKVEAKEEIMQYAEKIKQYDSGYQAPQISTAGCYVATAVYGSYDCPQVVALRKFRDTKLNTNALGKFFVRKYYALSPMMIKRFGNVRWIKRSTKYFLDFIVRCLNAQGSEDTSYQDRV